MKNWIIADLHFGEDRLDLMQRPFKSALAHTSTIILNHNEMVAPDDLVYVNGDVCYKNAPQWLPNVALLNGRKILLRGNHDQVFSDEDLKPYFEQIIPEGEGLQIQVGEIPCNIVHYPSLARKDYFNLVGHIHSAWKFQLNSLNVGVDVHHFRPVNLEKIPFYLKAISEFYDNDVWCAYSEANASFRETRGKKTSYFTPNE